MNRKLPPSASIATPGDGEKLVAPAAERNVQSLSSLLQRHAPENGRALEIASGTGQHVAAFAQALPGLSWQPSDISAERIASINSYGAETANGTIEPAIRLDATVAGWHRDHGTFDLIVLVNLLHLISHAEARVVIREAAAALSEGGAFILYGPFKRKGVLTSEGDVRFDADLRASDPEIGYKNDEEIRDWLSESGLSTVLTEEMPANNLTFIARA